MRQILLFAALAAVLALLLVSCGGTKDKPVPTEEDAPSKAAYHKISAEEAYEMMASQEGVVVDVRTREEYDGGTGMCAEGRRADCRADAIRACYHEHSGRLRYGLQVF